MCERKMNLKNQIYLYSLDTSAFYDDAEMEIHNNMSRLYIKRYGMIENNEDVTEVGSDLAALKDELCELFKQNRGTRAVRPEFLKPRNVVAMFECNTTRTFGMGTGELTDGMVIVRVYFFDVLRDMMMNRFMCNGEPYVFFASSAGQIRTKKAVFVKESLWNRCGPSLMGGLSVDGINGRGGISTNKFLSYLALCNGATEELVERGRAC